MKKTFTILLITLKLTAFSQENIEDSIKSNLIDLGIVNNNDENFEEYGPIKELLKDAEIVMLGEQSHGDGTAYETKIKLIKFLHQEMGFDILVFEAGFYDCQKAWSEIQNGADVRVSLGNSIFYLWSTVKEFKPLTDYIIKEMDSNNPLIISGFDSQWTGNTSSNFYLEDLKNFLGNINDSLIQTEDWEQLETSLKFLSENKYKELKKNKSFKDTNYINQVINYLTPLASDSSTLFWIQSLKSTKSYLIDTRYKSNLRDKQMAKNLSWIKKQNPNKKIICWGATSHFLYNSQEVKLKGFPYNLMNSYYKKTPMMGHYVKQEYGNKVYTIGFTAYQGTSGLTGKRDVKPPKESSVEYIIGKSDYENCLLPLESLTLSPFLSRPLSYVYMKNDITNVMDAVVFNRNMRRPRLDRNFFLEMYPENKWIKPEPIEEKTENNGNKL